MSDSRGTLGQDSAASGLRVANENGSVALSFRDGRCTNVTIRPDAARRPEHLSDTMLDLINRGLEQVARVPQEPLEPARDMVQDAVDAADEASQRQTEILGEIHQTTEFLQQHLDLLREQRTRLNDQTDE